MRIRSLQLIACLPFALFFSSIASGQQLRVAAAADLQFAFQDASSRFEMQTGHAVQLTFGSSGNFFSQIENGAPFDLFFSADVEYPKRLESEGLVQPGTLSRYATGEIVLWTRKESAIPLEEGLRALLKPGVRKIAVASPQLAPYGRAAVAALQHEGIYDQVRDKLVLGENISQAAQFVESGNADIGILALSLALAPRLREKGVYYEIPVSYYPTIEQGAVILKSSKQTELAEQFVDFLKKPEIVRLMKSYGLTVPGAGELRRSAKP